MLSRTLHSSTFPVLAMSLLVFAVAFAADLNCPITEQPYSDISRRLLDEPAEASCTSESRKRISDGWNVMVRNFLQSNKLELAHFAANQSRRIEQQLPSIPAEDYLDSVLLTVTAGKPVSKLQLDQLTSISPWEAVHLYFDLALHLSPDLTAHIREQRALYYANSNKLGLALSDLELAIAHEPQNAVLKLDVALCVLRIADTVTAKRYLEQAVALGNNEAAELLDRINQGTYFSSATSLVPANTREATETWLKSLIVPSIKAEIELKAYSQNGEDGILRNIFSAIGTTNRYMVEFGVQTGVECNGRYLREQGWTVLMFDTDETLGVSVKETITAENINDVFSKYAVPRYFDVLSIDIDGNDFWVWKALDNTRFTPRVVVMEVNSHFPPSVSKTIAYNPSHRWDYTQYYGGSVRAMRDLGLEKCYTLVYCESQGVNCFFVHNSVLGWDASDLIPIEHIYAGRRFDHTLDPLNRPWVENPTTGRCQG